MKIKDDFIGLASCLATSEKLTDGERSGIKNLCNRSAVGKGPIEVETTYWRSTSDETLYIVFRDNLRLYVENDPSISFKGVIIKKTYKIRKENAINSERYFGSASAPLGNEEVWECIQQQIHNIATTARDRQTPYVYIVVWTVVREEELRSGKMVYVSNDDIGICPCSLSEVPDHPYSNQSQLTEKHSAIKNSDASLSVRIDLVNNTNVDIDDKWVYIGNKSYKLATRTDNNIDSGLYVAARSINEHVDDPISISRMSLEDARLNWIYSTKESCDVGGDSKTKAAIQAEELKKENLILAESINMEKIEFSKAAAIEAHNANLEKIRKNNVLDGLKLLGGVLGVAGGIYALYTKLNSD